MATARTQTKIDRSTHTIRFERSLAAPRAEVFEAWTNPKHVAQWWDPTGTPLQDCSIDLRPGGSFSFVMGSTHAPPFTGVYKLIEKPSLLVFDANGAEGTVRLDEKSGATLMRVTIQCPSAEHLEMFIRLRVHEGTEQTMENLAAVVEAR
ncbi:MAG: SRPBCC domain-containing protein [Deltaproteobacteria bacterium]|nr:SRPBCC domain-containing protein [Deltaproteobacteria bacterium]